MKPNYTHLEVILDRSGSMRALQSDMIGGFNTFLEEQKKVPGTATISLTQFDDKYEPNYLMRSLPTATKLNERTYVPRGSTALHDAMGRAIVGLGAHLSALAEEERPSKVIVLVMTDGLENASREFGAESVAALVKEQREKYGWDFVFLGANQDAVLTAAHLNIGAASTMSWNATGAGAQAVYATASRGIAASRVSGQSVNYSAEDKAEVEKTK